MTHQVEPQYPLPVQEGHMPQPVCTDLVHVSKQNSQELASGPLVTPAESGITKEQLKDYLRQWVRIENEISTLSAEIKKRKLIHQQLSKSLLDVMRKNDIDCFDIANGRIVYSKTKIRAPLNNGQLKTALTNYYKDDVEKANSIAEFLLASRVEKTRESIKMKIPKIK
jgi:uncharacterized protein (UPF0335 family)